MAIFKRGYNAVTEEKQRQEEQRNKSYGLWRFFLKGDGEEAEITFLTDEPINYYEHSIKSYRNGKEFYENIPCLGDSKCKHCKSGDRPSFKSAWLVIDHRENSYTDKDGNKQTTTDNLRLFIFGTKIASQLDRLTAKYGILNRQMTIIRMGKGTSTSYTFERGDELDIDPDDINELLPEDMQDLYDGTVDSLYEIIEKQIMMMVDEDDSSEDSDEDDSANQMVSIDDEDEEEEVKPKSKFGNKKFSKESKEEPKTTVKKTASKFAKKETSVKKKTSIKSVVKKK